MLNKVVLACFIVAAASLVGAVVARFTLAPSPLQFEAKAFKGLADTVLLFTIAIGVFQIVARLKK